MSKTTLDEKLTSSLRAYAHINDDELGEDKFSGDFDEAKVIAAIHAAFKEDGAMLPDASGNYHISNARFVGENNRIEGHMTGQEWLSRFEKELADLREDYFQNKELGVVKSDAWKAARRAAGVDHD